MAVASKYVRRITLFKLQVRPFSDFSISSYLLCLSAPFTSLRNTHFLHVFFLPTFMNLLHQKLKILPSFIKSNLKPSMKPPQNRLLRNQQRRSYQHLPRRLTPSSLPGPDLLESEETSAPEDKT